MQQTILFFAVYLFKIIILCLLYRHPLEVHETYKAFVLIGIYNNENDSTIELIMVDAAREMRVVYGWRLFSFGYRTG